MTSVDVVIVTYKSTGLALRCIESVIRASNHYEGWTLTVLDNNSGDGTAEAIQSAFPMIDTIARDENSGFAVACNEGIRRGVGEFILLLNPDCEIESGIVEHLVEMLQSDPGIGLIGPRLVKADGTLDHAAKRNSPGPRAALTYLIGKHLHVPMTSEYLAPGVGEHEIGDVDAINGAFMMTRRTAVDEVGLLDERYWMYGEDLDWCRRFRAAGYRVVYDGRVTARHVKAGSSGSIRTPKVNWHFHKSMWMYYREDPTRGGVPERVAVGLGIASIWLVAGIRWLLFRMFR